MILQILADAGERHFCLDAVAAQLRGLADARQHQELRRVDGAAGEDDFACGIDLFGGPACGDVFDADGAMAVEQHAVDQRADFDGQTGPRQRRPQIGDRGAAAAAIADGHLPPGEALLLAAIEVIGPAETCSGA